MARPLHIERSGGRYHVTARGKERKAISATIPTGFISWPGRIPAGRVCCAPLMTLDMLPTIAWLTWQMVAGMHYAALGQAISRLGKRMEKDAELKTASRQSRKGNCQRFRCDPHVENVTTLAMC